MKTFRERDKPAKLAVVQLEGELADSTRLGAPGERGQLRAPAEASLTTWNTMLWSCWVWLLAPHSWVSLVANRAKVWQLQALRPSGDSVEPPRYWIPCSQTGLLII